jgi:hypothetical protein
MELEPKDNEIVRLLTILKKAEVAYPSEMLAPRRQKYIMRVAEIGVGLGVSPELKKTIKKGRSGAFTSTAARVLETALIVAIAAEASAAAYFYRDKIADLIQSYSSTPQVQELTSPPEFPSSLPELNATEIPETTGTPTPTASPTGTSLLAESTDNNGIDINNQAVFTPNPNGNNGNHFGQTPKPERTKKNGDNNGGNDNGNNGNGKDK